MARFVIGEPVTTVDPVVVVDDGLSAGRHVFLLVVVDADHNVSPPCELIVTVQAAAKT